MTFDAVVTLDSRLSLEIPQLASSPLFPCSTSGGRQRAALNQGMLAAILPWLQEDYSSDVHLIPSRAALPSIWEFLNGTTIAVADLRLVLLPTTEIDSSELRVAQEWVDIPTWVADYYVAVFVNLEDGYLEIVGYTSHRRLKQQATFDASDRTYSLDVEHLTPDVSLLFLSQQLCPEEGRRSQVTPLPPLDVAQAENLLSRLGNPEVIFPRLAVPFTLWAALLEHGGWRKRLYALRQGLDEAWSVGQWLQTGISSLAQQLGWIQATVQLQPVRVGMRSPTPNAVGLSRRLQIGDRAYDLYVVGLGVPEERTWRFQLQSATSDPLPAGMVLRLLTEDLQAFENNQDVATEGNHHLYVDVMLAPGEGLVWEVSPRPENYDREILRF